MRIPGERVKRIRLVRSGRFVVAVPVELVIPEDDPSEPCYESETIQLIREVAERAERGDTAWLEQHGEVYKLVDSGSI